MKESRTSPITLPTTRGSDDDTIDLAISFSNAHTTHKIKANETEGKKKKFSDPN